MGMIYGTSNVPLEVFIEADFAMMPGAGSTTSMFFSMYEGPVIWQSKLHPTRACSTSKAAQQATNADGREALWILKVIIDL